MIIARLIIGSKNLTIKGSMSQKKVSEFFKPTDGKKRSREDFEDGGGNSKVQDLKEKVLNVHKQERREKEAKKKVFASSEKFDFALPENIRDMEGRAPSDPDYDGRTIFIPPAAFLRMTPFERQFWEMKQKLYDTVIFFRKGIFYELFERDARIGHQEFGLSITTRASMIMCGFSVNSFEEKAAVLLAKNYRVARVDQDESSVGMEKRLREGTSASKLKTPMRSGVEGEEKLIKRSVVEILTPGTLKDPNIGGMIQKTAPRIMSVWQGEDNVFGVCIVECATHTLLLSSFKDDGRLGHLETLMLRAAPKEVIFCKGAVTPQAQVLFRSRIPKTLTYLREPETEFWNDENARVHLEKGWDSANRSDAGALLSDKAALWAAGGALGFLQDMGLLDGVLHSLNVGSCDALPTGQVSLDGSTLANLQVLEGRGSLLNLLDHTVTSQGANVLRQWVSAPFVDEKLINERLEAIDVLNSCPEWTKCLQTSIKGLPDLMRLGALCASGTSTAKKLATLAISSKGAWKTMVRLFGHNAAFLEEEDVPYYPERSCALLTRITTLLPTTGAALEECLWSLVENWNDVKDKGVMNPRKGMDEECDQAREELEGLSKKLKQIGGEAVKVDRSACFVNVGKHKHLLEVSLAAKVPENWEYVNCTSKKRRYTTPEVQEVVLQERDLEDVIEVRQHSFLAEAQRKVAEGLRELSILNGIVAQLDCLLSLATFVRNNRSKLCRPEVSGARGKDCFFAAEGLAHPLTLVESPHVGNKVVMGEGGARTLIITGPNMGGKSTLLRAVALACILAQLGCWVPATSLRLSVVDRVFTRIGARDDLAQGTSTFLMEMLEASAVLNHATPDSLVVLDELGRGTSTHDGYAVAYAATHRLAHALGCRTLFATHYHALPSDFASQPQVAPLMLSYHVDNTVDPPSLVFLFVLRPGITPSSFGMNVARIANVPERIVARADDLSNLLQRFEGYAPAIALLDFWTRSGKTEK